MAYRGESGRYAPPGEPLAASSDEEEEVVVEDEEAMDGAMEVRLGVGSAVQMLLLGQEWRWDLNFVAASAGMGTSLSRVTRSSASLLLRRGLACSCC